MNEVGFATLARQYVRYLDHQNDMKPLGWSQEEHLREDAWRKDLLSQMRDALGGIESSGMNKNMASISCWGLFPSWYDWDYERSPWFYVEPDIEHAFTFVGDFA